MKKKYDFECIQALRAVACILVVLCHTSFTNFGSFGVDFFLVISGFVTMYATEKNAEKFLFKRIIKIIPLYWFMTIVTAIAIQFVPQLFNSSESNLIYLFKSLLFIPYRTITGNKNPVFQIGWFLNYQILFYFLFWIGIKINCIKRGLITIILCIIITCSNWIFILPMPFSFYSDGYLLECCYGIIIYRIYYKTKNCVAFKISKTQLLILYCIMFVVGCWLMNDLTYRIIPCFGSGFLAGLIILFLLLIKDNILFPKELIDIGNSSYCIYLLHPYLVRLMDIIGTKLLGNFAGIIIIDIVMACTCGLLWYKYIEIPIQNNLKNKFC